MYCTICNLTYCNSCFAKEFKCKKCKYIEIIEFKNILEYNNYNKKC